MNHKMVTACSTVQIMQVRDKGVPSSYHSKWWSVFVEWWLHHCSPLPCIVESIPYVITVFTHTRYTDRHHTHTHTNRTQRGRHTHRHRPFYTQTLSHKDPFTKKQMLLHTNAFTHRGFYIQKLLHTDPFTHKSFYTHTCKRAARQPPKSQFHLSFGHSTRPSFHAKGLRANLRNRNFTTCFDIKTYESEQSAANAMSSYRKYHVTSDFDDRTSFRGKGLRRSLNRNFTTVFGDRTSFRARVVAAQSKSQFHCTVFGDRSSFRAKWLPPRW